MQVLERFNSARKVVALEALAPLTDEDLETLVRLMGKVVDSGDHAHTGEGAHD